MATRRMRGGGPLYPLLLRAVEDRAYGHRWQVARVSDEDTAGEEEEGGRKKKVLRMMKNSTD